MRTLRMGLGVKVRDRKGWMETHQYPLPGILETDDDAKHGMEGETVEEFVQRVASKRFQGLIDAFFMLNLSENEDISEGTAFKQSENTEKNRYDDCTLLDHSRVMLKDGLPGDYIHASFVDGYRNKKTYISTQAPTDKTMVDFWRMVWQEKVVVVVMLTKLVEGTVKSAAYWPQTARHKIRYGPFLVTNTKIDHRSVYELTHVKIRDLRTGKERMLMHFLYTDWPDHCIPLDMEGFMHFCERVRWMQYLQTGLSGWKGPPAGPPIVVHCSGGIGRTGTLQCVDISFKRLIHCGKIDIDSTIKGLRKQRSDSVQSNHQYLFIFTVMLSLIKQEGLYPDLRRALNPSEVVADNW